ncbi:uncharacterized protein HKW66_Vig0149750 [Vigna angularis]|uniref:Uncharacterized protein n=1 Tax=Phaseolus angularis TaxID=3914 RepID=A0A8T0JU99_PHAAN|nr:uncharacterized protein HKW66_Vig0149750 [Vigna angularis]
MSTATGDEDPVRMGTTVREMRKHDFLTRDGLDGATDGKEIHVMMEGRRGGGGVEAKEMLVNDYEGRKLTSGLIRNLGAHGRGHPLCKHSQFRVKDLPLVALIIFVLPVSTSSFLLSSSLQLLSFSSAAPSFSSCFQFSCALNSPSFAFFLLPLGFSFSSPLYDPPVISPPSW